MINLMVANMQETGRYSPEKTKTLLRAQIENSLEVGWEQDEICLITNFDFKYEGVQAITVELNKHCLTGSKMFAVQWHMKEFTDVTDTIWAHDLDCWQNCWFDEPDLLDVGISTYSQPHKYNGGSLFWKPTASDIVDHVVKELAEQQREEPTLNKLLKRDYKERTTVLNNTFNVGCSGFVKRAVRAHRPIRVAHLNPMNRIAWDTHVCDRNKVGIISVGYRLQKLLRRHFSGRHM